MTSWSYYEGNIPTRAFEQDSIVPVRYDSNGRPSVTVTPLRLGKAELWLTIFFADGGVQRETIDLQVGQTDRQPEKLVVAWGGEYRNSLPVFSLDLSDAFKTRGVGVAAIYKTVALPVHLRPSEVSFRWIASTGTGVAAEIDPSTGMVTARYVGQALLETSFGGISTLTCIDVMKNVGGGLRSRCKELLPSGRKLPPSLEEMDSTPPPVVKVRRP